MDNDPIRCERCKAEIPPERLEALPDTVICCKCSKEIGGEFKLEVIPDSLGKSTSLKKNYGVFSLKKTRKTIRPVAEEAENV
jgi:RNA polymerase-binding transcription factor DksA